MNALSIPSSMGTFSKGVFLLGESSVKVNSHCVVLSTQLVENRHAVDSDSLLKTFLAIYVGHSSKGLWLSGALQRDIK